VDINGKHEQCYPLPPSLLVSEVALGSIASTILGSGSTAHSCAPNHYTRPNFPASNLPVSQKALPGPSCTIPRRPPFALGDAVLRKNPDTSVATDVVIKPGMTNGAGIVATEWKGASGFCRVRWPLARLTFLPPHRLQLLFILLLYYICTPIIYNAGDLCLLLIVRPLSPAACKRSPGSGGGRIAS
jgi:hypothetical protein